MLAQRKKQPERGLQSGYATRSDFHEIFTKDIERLYLLALLLTGNQLEAEQCFIAAFDGCAGGGLTFRECAVLCSRRNVIKAAIHIISPKLCDEYTPTLLSRIDLKDSFALLRVVLRLQPFDRFVFVLTVLESYSDRESSVLLGCTTGEILAARLQAFKQISSEHKGNFCEPATGDCPCLVDADWLECG